MTSDDRLNELARAIGDGTTIDWTSTESTAVDESTRRVIRELSVIAAIAGVHSTALPAAALQAAEGRAVPPSDGWATWGPFRLLEKVGQGAFGEVYRAWDTRLDREVALKLLPAGMTGDSSRTTTLIDEGRLLARVRHPNVVTIHGAERIDNRVGLWMEFVHGQTLDEILASAGPFTSADATAIALELCRAVAAVHASGLVHRDIKAQNVMRADDGRIALMDFGAGRAFDDETPLELAGTPLYLAPEVLAGQPATVQSDVYSLGVLLYHLVTGTYPVRGRTVGDLRRAHERGERAPVVASRHVSSTLARVIERAIDPSPERRFSSAEALRAALAGDPSRPRLRRIVAVTAVTAAVIGAVAVGWTRWSVRPFVAPGAQPVLAVLPFRNLSVEPDTEWFADALTEEIVRDLAGVDGMQVRSSASSFAWKGKPRNVREVGERLGVDLVVEGSARRAGARLIITAQMIEVTGNEPIWSARFDREAGDVFSVRQEVSRAIVDRLRLTLVDRRPRHEPNLAAYDSYLRGRALVDRRGIENMQRAAGHFERAIALDPAFAQAHAGLANAYAFMSFPNRGISFATAYPIMRPAAVQAFTLDPLLAESHVAMGWVYAFERDWANAERSFREAIRLNPSLTQASTSYSISTLQALRRFDEALRVLRDAAVHDPLSLDLQREVGEVQLFSGRFEDAVNTFRRILDVDPTFPFVDSYLATALVFAGRSEEALTLWRAGAIWPATAYVRLGRRAEAERLGVEHAAFPFRVAIIAAALGDVDRTVEAVERVALHEPHRVGRLLIHPELAPFRDHPRIASVRTAFSLP